MDFIPVNQSINDKHSEVLSVVNLSKDYEGIQVLQNVSFTLMRGEVHAIVGENGAGKSTLLKIIAGVISRDKYKGDIILDNQKVEFFSIKQAQQKGIALIHQELALAPTLSVYENITLGDEETSFCGINYKESIRRAEKALHELDVEIDLNSNIEQLGVGQKQIVEIAKALTRNFDILILDEPTAALSEKEVAVLLKLISKLSQSGKSIIYVSHRLSEVFNIANRVTILRDGKLVGTYLKDTINQKDIVQLMVGRDIIATTKQRNKKNMFERDDILQVSSISPLGRTHVDIDSKSLGLISFTLKKGEILGLAGLVGSGRTEFLEVLFGIRKINKEGSILINSTKSHINSPLDAIRGGLAFVSEDRKENGLIVDHSIRSNTSITVINRYSTFGYIRSRDEASSVIQICSKLGVKFRSIESLVSSLSGGNQQKVVLAKWLLAEPEILLLDEPTRGIDIAAKGEIYQIILDLAADGMSIIVASSELPELFALSDRIIALSDGYMAGDFVTEQTNEVELMHAMTKAFRKSRSDTGELPNA